MQLNNVLPVLFYFILFFLFSPLRTTLEKQQMKYKYDTKSVNTLKTGAAAQYVHCKPSRNSWLACT